MRHKSKITIAELEKKTGVKRSTIHHYVRSGLLHSPDKTSQTMAYYDQSHLIKLNAIENIKKNFLKDSDTSRVPLDFIKDRLEESLQKNPDNTAAPRPSDPAPVLKSPQKKAQIIKVAISLYSENGYRKTTIRDITKKVGISNPAFYHYFPDKRELFIEVIEFVITQWRTETQSVISQINDPTEKGVLIFEIFQKHHSKIAEILDHLRVEAATGDLWAESRLKQIHALLLEDVLKSTRTAIKKGIMRDLNPELMAYFLLKIDEAAIQKLALDDRYKPSTIMSFVADIIAFGFLTPQRRRQMTLADRTDPAD